MKENLEGLPPKPVIKHVHAKLRFRRYHEGSIDIWDGFNEACLDAEEVTELLLFLNGEPASGGPPDPIPSPKPPEGAVRDEHGLTLAERGDFFYHHSMIMETYWRLERRKNRELRRKFAALGGEALDKGEGG